MQQVSNTRAYGVQMPLQTHERQAWRVQHCLALSGDWSGTSQRIDPLTGQTIETIWASTKLFFEPQTGKIKGEGISIWQDQSFTFELIGAFSHNLHTVELLKTHRNGSVTHLAFAVDLQNQTLNGNFANGGTCTLQKMNGLPGVGALNNGGVFPQQHMQRGISNTSAGSGVGAVPEAPKDLLTFLHYCFSDSPGIAAKIHTTLQENEIHDPESLTQLSHEEWREIGVVLGHRSKIKLQLQRFFPHLMKMQSEEPTSGGTGAISPTQSSSSDAGQPNPPYHSHPSMVGGVPPPSSYGNVLPSNPQAHYVSASQSLYSASPAAFSGASFANIPLEYLCPITRELMDDPVLASDGHSYDRASIQQWLELKKTSPITNKILASKALTQNIVLRKEIAAWKAQMQGQPQY